MRPVISGAATLSWQLPINTRRWGEHAWITNTWPAVVAQLESNAPALSAALDALRRNPKGVPYDFRGENYKLGIEPIHQCVKLRYWLTWATANNLREGKLDDAGEDILAMAQLGRSFRSNHPNYYGDFMQRTLNATWELLQSSPTNDAQLAALQDIWLKGSTLPDYPRSDEEYRAWDLKRIEAQTWRTTNADAVWEPPRDFGPTKAALWFLGGRYFDEFAVLVISQDRLHLTRALAQSRRWSSWPGEHRLRVILWALPWDAVCSFAYREDWYFSEHMLRAAEYETHREMTVGAIALQRYRLRRGQWPEKLNDLVPELLAELPRDWMNGEPLRYRRTPNDTFTLYSVGEDLRDDGGDLTPVYNGNMDAHPQPMWTTRDAVWPLVATKETVDALKKAAAAKKQSPQPQTSW